MKLDEKAILKTKGGDTLILKDDHTWKVSKGTPVSVREILADNPAEETIDGITNDWEPYVELIAGLTDATVEDMEPYPDYPPDTIF